MHISLEDCNGFDDVPMEVSIPCNKINVLSDELNKVAWAFNLTEQDSSLVLAKILPEDI